MFFINMKQYIVKPLSICASQERNYIRFCKELNEHSDVASALNQLVLEDLLKLYKLRDLISSKIVGQDGFSGIV